MVNDRLAGIEERPVEIDINDVVPILPGEIFRRVAPLNARGGAKDVKIVAKRFHEPRIPPVTMACDIKQRVT